MTDYSVFRVSGCGSNHRPETFSCPSDAQAISEATAMLERDPDVNAAFVREGRRDIGWVMRRRGEVVVLSPALEPGQRVQIASAASATVDAAARRIAASMRDVLAREDENAGLERV